MASSGFAAAIFSTLWATGGWSALRRRVYSSKISTFAKGLPECSAARVRLTEHAESEIEIYLYRIAGEQSPHPYRAPAGRVLLVVVVVLVIRFLFPDPGMVVIYVVEGVFIAVVVWAYADIARYWWIKRGRHRHNELLKEARQVPDSRGGGEAKQVELG